MDNQKQILAQSSERFVGVCYSSVGGKFIFQHPSHCPLYRSHLLLVPRADKGRPESGRAEGVRTVPNITVQFIHCGDPWKEQEKVVFFFVRTLSYCLHCSGFLSLHVDPGQHVTQPQWSMGVNLRQVFCQVVLFFSGWLAASLSLLHWSINLNLTFLMKWRTLTELPFPL